MAKTFQQNGIIRLAAKVCDLEQTLLGGQSFRWRKLCDEPKTKYCGVALNTYWVLTPDVAQIAYEAHGDVEQQDRNFKALLYEYLRADFDLEQEQAAWMEADEHFSKFVGKPVRILSQEPLENIISFMCSQNNNIKRISAMIQWFCSAYGTKIGHFHGQDEYMFPTLKQLSDRTCSQLDAELRAAKFGYRAKFIARSLQLIQDNGGDAWLEQLCQLDYAEARETLVQLPGVGYKVADCICLMSLAHLEAVPVDTHIYKLAQRYYLPHLNSEKSVTPTIYTEVAQHFQELHGPFAGWAQAVLFCATLPQFQLNKEENKVGNKEENKKKEVNKEENKAENKAENKTENKAENKAEDKEDANKEENMEANKEEIKEETKEEIKEEKKEEKKEETKEKNNEANKKDNKEKNMEETKEEKKEEIKEEKKDAEITSKQTKRKKM